MIDYLETIFDNPISWTVFKSREHDIRDCHSNS